MKRVTWEDKINPEEYIIEEYSKTLENLIIKYPDQWVWWHRRWRRRPEIDYKQYPELLPSSIEYVRWIQELSKG